VKDIGALNNLMLWGLISLHSGLSPLLELGPLLLLNWLKHRVNRRWTNPESKVAARLVLALLLSLALHCSTTVLQN
jgi:hypothetical protein